MQPEDQEPNPMPRAIKFITTLDRDEKTKTLSSNKKKTEDGMHHGKPSLYARRLGWGEQNKKVFRRQNEKLHDLRFSWQSRQ